MVAAPEPAQPETTLTGVAARYDGDGDGRIERAEYLRAVDDYDEAALSILELLQVRRTYLAGLR